MLLLGCRTRCEFRLNRRVAWVLIGLALAVILVVDTAAKLYDPAALLIIVAVLYIIVIVLFIWIRSISKIKQASVPSI